MATTVLESHSGQQLLKHCSLGPWLAALSPERGAVIFCISELASTNITSTVMSKAKTKYGFLWAGGV
jgi:hypothetical protein